MVQGVGYGPLSSDGGEEIFPAPDCVDRDFKTIAKLGANTVRTSTPPSHGVMDAAARSGLRVIVGAPWPRQLAFLDGRQAAEETRHEIRSSVKALASHPSTLLFALGSEISPAVVRWYGRRRVERFLREIVTDVKEAAPDAVLTYINQPQTEYLDTSCFDVCAFGVSLEAGGQMRAYLARLHHVAGSRPLLLVDSSAATRPTGEHQMAQLTQRLHTALSEGVCGAIAINWTDDWRRQPERQAVHRVFSGDSLPQSQQAAWPRVSVIVCAYNAADSIDECLTALEQLRYPDVDVVVVDDGSTDETAAIVERHRGVRLIQTRHAGLASARNVGLARAACDIVAYADADVRVDPDWLAYLVQPFIHSDVVAAGGPNIVPPDDPWLAQCVARAPGGPTHVLLDDRVAEHIPGCNCAFRREALLAIGGFNPKFLRAGDDVDVCWRLQARGWRIGFAAAALVWHHHRASVRAYLKQQIGYGEGETWLMREHPERFVQGRIAWRGHIYSPLPFVRSLSTLRINAGPFGSAAFPSIYRACAHPLAYLPHSGRWQIASLILLALATAASYTRASYGAAVWMAASFGAGATIVKCLLYGFRSDVATLPAIGRLRRHASRTVYCVIIAALHFLQPLARMYGRVRGALSRPVPRPVHSRELETSPQPSTRAVFVDGLRLLSLRDVEKVFWSEHRIDISTLLAAMANRLRCQRAVRHIELDSGWWEDRDLTLVYRHGARLDVRTLLDEQDGATCLYRLRIRSNATVVAWPLLLAIATVALLHRAGPIAWLAGAVVAATIAARDTLTTARTLASAFDGTAADLGMRSIPEPATSTGRSVPIDGRARARGPSGVRWPAPSQQR